MGESQLQIYFPIKLVKVQTKTPLKAQRMSLNNQRIRKILSDSFGDGLFCNSSTSLRKSIAWLFDSWWNYMETRLLFFNEL